jgi:XRE family transcriptional regulator, aerobic/anaerobic benzoate catabolism transcriptional regulator
MAESELLQRLAERVRERRLAHALTLRQLAKRSGVSERYLVLLEGGKANVSVTRLDDIARALETTPGELLEDGDGQEIIESARAVGPLVALLGLRGAGKSAVGARVADRLKIPFTELDALVVARAGMSLSEIFELHGNGYYRRLEREELDRLISTKTHGIVATGGSLVTEPQTFERLRGAAVTVWLRATAEDHWNRVVAQGDVRPMQNRTSAMKELRALLRARGPLYEQADVTIDTSSLGLDRAVDQVVKIARDARRGPPDRGWMAE